MNEPGAKERCRVFLRLIAGVFPKGRGSGLPLICLGLAAQKKWHDRPPLLPTAKSMSMISRINWHAEVPAFSQKYAVLLIQLIERRWHE